MGPLAQPTWRCLIQSAGHLALINLRHWHPAVGHFPKNGAQGSVKLSPGTINGAQAPRNGAQGAKMESQGAKMESQGRKLEPQGRKMDP